MIPSNSAAAVYQAMVLCVCLCFKKVQIPRQSTVAMLGGGVAVISAIYIFSEFYDLCSSAPRMAASGTRPGWEHPTEIVWKKDQNSFVEWSSNICKLFLHVLSLLHLCHLPHRTATLSDEIPPYPPSFPRLPVAARAELWSAAAAVFSPT